MYVLLSLAGGMGFLLWEDKENRKGAVKPRPLCTPLGLFFRSAWLWRCVTLSTFVCILRYSGCSSLPSQSSVCYDIQNGSLCRSGFLHATLFQNASLCLSGVLYATLFKMPPFTYLIHIHYKKLHTTRTGCHSARFRPSAGLFSPFRSECTAEAQDTGWLCFCRRGALLRWRESALFFKSSLFERSEFGLLENAFSRFPAA